MRQPGWRDAGVWFIFTTLGFLLPAFIGILFHSASGNSVTLEWIAGRGQFAVSSAGLLMTTSYFVARPSSIIRLPYTEWFLVSAIIGLVLGVSLYSLAALASGGTEIKSNYYVLPSIGLFAVALLIAFIAVGLDRKRDFDEPGFLESGIKAEQSKTEEEFNRTF